MERIANVLRTVTDPEIPVLSIIDMGVVRDYTVQESGEVLVKITPTYSGCPAMNMIAVEIRAALDKKI